MSSNSAPGCLRFLAQLLGFGSSQADGARALPYRTKDSVLTRAELSFYQVLVQAVGQSVVVLCKVSLDDVFYVSTGSDRMAFHNKIDRKHVDFLLCDRVSLKPIAGIELDDSSHANPKNQTRDQFKDQVFAAASLPLIRVKAQAAYSVEALRRALATASSRPAPTPSATPPAVEPGTPTTPARQPGVSGAPVCPKCGVPMVLRQARKGGAPGQQFWGCPNYPDCRHVVALT